MSALFGEKISKRASMELRKHVPDIEFKKFSTEIKMVYCFFQTALQGGYMDIRKVTGELVSTGLIELTKSMHEVMQDFKDKKISKDEAGILLKGYRQVMQAVAIDWAYNKENVSERLARLQAAPQPTRRRVHEIEGS